MIKPAYPILMGLETLPRGRSNDARLELYCNDKEKDLQDDEKVFVDAPG